MNKKTLRQTYDRSADLVKLIALFILSVIVLIVLTGGRFLSGNQLGLIAYLFPEMGMMSLGMMLAMISGGIDLTVVAVADLAGIVSCLLLKQIMPAEASMAVQILVLLVVLLCAMAVGALCGLFSGTLIARMGIPPMVATLGASDVILGIAVGITKGSSIKELPTILNAVTSAKLFGAIPVTTIIYLISSAVIAFILYKTGLGFKIYMLGSNATASKFSAIDNIKITTITYILSGVLSSISGLLMCGHFNSARSDFGSSYLTPAILICVLGGINPNGGRGKVSGMIAAVIILQTLSSGFSLFPTISDYYKNLIWGVVLIAIMIINVTSERRKLKKS